MQFGVLLKRVKSCNKQHVIVFRDHDVEIIFYFLYSTSCMNTHLIVTSFDSTNRILTTTRKCEESIGPKKLD